MAAGDGLLRCLFQIKIKTHRNRSHNNLLSNVRTHYTENHIANEFNKFHCTQWLFNFKTNYVNCIYEKLRTERTHKANMLIISIYIHIFGKQLEQNEHCTQTHAHSLAGKSEWISSNNRQLAQLGIGVTAFVLNKLFRDYCKPCLGFGSMYASTFVTLFSSIFWFWLLLLLLLLLPLLKLHIKFSI